VYDRTAVHPRKNATEFVRRYRSTHFDLDDAETSWTWPRINAAIRTSLRSGTLKEEGSMKAHTKTLTQTGPHPARTRLEHTDLQKMLWYALYLVSKATTRHATIAIHLNDKSISPKGSKGE
jgi:hypothetical protein